MRKNILLLCIAMLLPGATGTHVATAYAAKTAAEICHAYNDDIYVSLVSPYPEFWEMQHRETLYRHAGKYEPTLDELPLDGFDDIYVQCLVYPSFKEQAWLNRIIDRWTDIGYADITTYNEVPVHGNLYFTINLEMLSIEVVYPVDGKAAHNNPGYISFIGSHWKNRTSPAFFEYASTYNLASREELQ